MKKNNYKVGDKVLLVSKRPSTWSQDGAMDVYLGKVVTIERFIFNDNFGIKEDDSIWGWVFRFDDIVRKVNKEHFKSYPNNYTGTLNIENGYVIEEKEILDETEKKYLENVIRPFKDKVTYIEKFDFSSKEFINIDIKDDASIGLPNFPKNTMYNGMKIRKKYTLEELRLFEE